MIIKYIKRMICMSVILCIGLIGVFMTGCNDVDENDKNELPKNCDVVLEDFTAYFTEESKNFIEICNTFDEFEEVFERNNYDFYKYNQVSEQCEKVRDYMNEHTEDKSLVVCAFVEGAYWGPYRIKEVETADGKLTMYIKLFYASVSVEGFPMGETRMNSAVFVAGINKSVASDITELSYVVI